MKGAVRPDRPRLTRNQHKENPTTTKDLPQLTQLRLDPETVLGGATSQGIVRLDIPAPAGDITVEVKSNRPDVAFPAQQHVTVPEGSRTRAFTVNTNPVSNQTPVTVTAFHQNVQKAVTLRVQQPSIKTFTFSQSTIPFGDVARGTIILDGPAPSNTSISLRGVDENGYPDGVAERAAEFPANVAVSPNATRVTFEAKRKDGAGAFGQTVRIKASYLEGTIVIEVRVEGLPT